jgi:hypothetical protein
VATVPRETVPRRNVKVANVLAAENAEVPAAAGRAAKVLVGVGRVAIAAGRPNAAVTGIVAIVVANAALISRPK